MMDDADRLAIVKKDKVAEAACSSEVHRRVWPENFSVQGCYKLDVASSQLVATDTDFKDPGFSQQLIDTVNSLLKHKVVPIFNENYAISIRKAPYELENCHKEFEEIRNTSRQEYVARFVKVNMDGDSIGRKVDLSAHQSYETLPLALEMMFHKPTTSVGSSTHCAKASKLLDGSSEFAMTCEDKDGDWMLVGDVPWGMFLDTVRRLRIMRTCDANGLDLATPRN